MGLRSQGRREDSTIQVANRLSDEGMGRNEELASGLLSEEVEWNDRDDNDERQIVGCQGYLWCAILKIFLTNVGL